VAPLLHIDRVSAGYGKIEVLHDVTLAVPEGSVVALLGPNGAGKTTTLLALSGILPALAGRAAVLGATVRAGATFRLARRGLAHVPEERCLFPGLTVGEHLRLAGARSRSDRGRVLDQLPVLEPLLDRKVGLLSGGEQQQLALGLALARRPRALLVDELSHGLAPKLVERLLPVLGGLAHEHGVAVLMVEQHVHAALGVADRAAVLRGGRLVLEGPASELLERRRDLEAAYLGEGGS
jgi:branched-chain amino acid transport system ATP-binding protein